MILTHFTSNKAINKSLVKAISLYLARKINKKKSYLKPYSKLEMSIKSKEEKMCSLKLKSYTIAKMSKKMIISWESSMKCLKIRNNLIFNLKMKMILSS